MRRRLLLVAAIASLVNSSCENQALSLRLHYPRITVDGLYANTLTLEDLRQIQAAVLTEKAITEPIRDVDVDAPGHVRVLTDESRVIDRKFVVFDFEVTKKHGAWIVDRKRIRKNNGSISSANDRNGVIVD